MDDFLEQLGETDVSQILQFFLSVRVDFDETGRSLLAVEQATRR